MIAGPPFGKLLPDHIQGAARGRLVRYAELLEEWSGTHNLVRVSSRKELVERHLLDALAGTRLLKARGRLLDIGSGAGLPGIPLLIARSGWTGVLLEPRRKRWAFLKRVIRELGLPATAVDRRYQELDPGERFDLVTARAVGGHNAILDWAGGCLAPGGGVALWLTEEGEREVSEVRGWRMLSWPLVGLDRGRLVHLAPENAAAAGTDRSSQAEPEGHCST
jgi:16S rRNA (guanine527-N7)-methyltransferase